MTRWLTTLTVLSIAMLSIGCVRTSHQLSEVAETVTDDEIVGVREEQDQPNALFKGGKRLAIQKHKHGFYIQRDLDRNDECTAVFKLIKVGEVIYPECSLIEWLDLRGEKPSEEELQASADQPINFFPLRWERRGEWFAIWQPDHTVVKQLLQNGKLAGRVDKGLLIDDVSITSSAEELAACLEEYSDEIYAINAPRPGHKTVYRRVSTQVPATTQETTRTP